MKKIVILAVFAAVFAAFIFFLTKPPQQQKKAIEASKELSGLSYSDTMLKWASQIKNINNGKLVYRNKTVSFVPKKDPFGHGVAVNYYSAEKKMLEDIKAKYLATSCPPAYLDVHKLFGEALDNEIAIFDKALEALQKDDKKLMDKERIPLFKKAESLLPQVIQRLQEIKMRQDF